MQTIKKVKQELDRLVLVAKPYVSQKTQLTRALSIAKDHENMHLHKARKHKRLTGLFFTTLIACTVGLAFQPIFPMMTTLLSFAITSGIVAIVNRTKQVKQKNFATDYRKQSESLTNQIKNNNAFLNPLQKQITEQQNLLQDLNQKAFEKTQEPVFDQQKTSVAKQVIDQNNITMEHTKK